VTEDPATDIYGIAIDREQEAVDVAGTEQQRRAIPTQRLGRPPAVDTRKRRSIAASGRPPSENLQVVLEPDGVEFVQCVARGSATETQRGRSTL
jgi:hypothetical protein